MLGSQSSVASDSDSIAVLLRAARAGCQTSLGQLLEHYRGYLLILAQGTLDADLRRKGSDSDLVQETFLEAQRDFEAFYGEDRESLARWLRGILRHNATDFVRRHKLADRRSLRRELPCGEDSTEDWENELPSDASSPSARASANEQEQRLHAAIASLPADYRTVVQARSIERQPWSKVAAQMGRSEGAVQKLWVRAIEMLRDLFTLEP